MIFSKSKMVLESMESMRSFITSTRKWDAQDRAKGRESMNTISNDMPVLCGGTDQAPEVAASDDDDGGDDDGEPARRRSKKQSPTFRPSLLGFAPLSHDVGMGRSQIYQQIKAGKFPPPIKIGKSSRWITAEIDAWIKQQAAQRTGA